VAGCPATLPNDEASRYCGCFEEGDITLSRVPLAETGLEISRVGLGAWAMGGAGWVFSWAEQDDRQSIATVHRAVELGINWVDTAPVYGFGHSEEVVGRAIRALPDADRPLVFTKCGVIANPEGRMLPTLQVGATALLRKDLEASLRRLGVECIDLYQMHQPPEDGTPLEEYWGALLGFRTEGLVRAVGLSNHGVQLLERAEALGHIGSLQPPLSLLNRGATGDVIPWCANHGTGVIVYSPMESGLLTGAFSVARVGSLPDGDWRKRSPMFEGKTLRPALALVDALRPIAERRGTGVGALAIAWTLAVQGVTGAIAGARRPEQVTELAEAASLLLLDTDVAEIRAALRRTRAGTGPVS
jgi:aryl-alcohol dehydrogenase-like predicted oxidoreductase